MFGGDTPMNNCNIVRGEKESTKIKLKGDAMTRQEALDNLYGLSEKSNPEFVDTYVVERLINAIYDSLETRMYKKCPRCGFDKNKIEYNYCIECGAKL